jgi:ATP-dependent DNA ligase
MLAQEYREELVDDSEIYNISQKLDGARYNIRLSKDKGVEIIGRHSDKLHNYKYPEIEREAIQLIRDEKITLDGEMVVGSQYGTWILNNFSALQSREHTENKKQIELLSRIIPAKFIVFDILTPETIKLPLSERMEILMNFFGQYKDLTYIKPIYNINGDINLAKKLFQQASDLGLEGIMIKKLDSLYEDKRSDAWLKWKCYKETDEKIIGYTRKERQISALILESGTKVNAVIDDYWQNYILKQDISIEKETAEETQYYFAKPSLIAVVKYLERGNNNILRFPILKEIRKI